MVERNLGQSLKWKIATALASAAAVGGLVVGKESDKQVNLDTPTPNYSLHLPIDEKLKPTLKEEVAVSLEPGAVEKARIEAVIEKVVTNPQVFGPENVTRFAEDLRLYYPIYHVAADRYQLPWYLLWIIHEAESKASRDENAFKPGFEHYGAMQRSKYYHPDEIVDKISSNLAILAFLPQRHYDDWREIVWAAAKIAEDRAKTGSLESALYRYSSAQQAELRWQLFLKYSEILEK